MSESLEDRLRRTMVAVADQAPIDPSWDRVITLPEVECRLDSAGARDGRRPREAERPRDDGDRPPTGEPDEVTRWSARSLRVSTRGRRDLVFVTHRVQGPRVPSTLDPLLT